MLAHTNVPFKGHSEIRESGKLHSKPLFYYFSLGAPETYFDKVGCDQTRRVSATGLICLHARSLRFYKIAEVYEGSSSVRFDLTDISKN